MAAESAVLSGVEPRACWRHFEALTKIARPSRHEEPVIEHVRGWAAEHGFELRQDAARNLVVRVPATAGRESAPVLVLQGHLDMVCERLPGQPLRSGRGQDRPCSRRRLADRRRDDARRGQRHRDRRDDGAGRGRIAAARPAGAADDDELGADDGIGVAAMMALAEEASLPHGRSSC